MVWDVWKEARPHFVDPPRAAAEPHRPLTPGKAVTVVKRFINSILSPKVPRPTDVEHHDASPLSPLQKLTQWLTSPRATPRRQPTPDTRGCDQPDMEITAPPELVLPASKFAPKTSVQRPARHVFVADPSCLTSAPNLPTDSAGNLDMQRMQCTMNTAQGTHLDHHISSHMQAAQKKLDQQQQQNEDRHAQKATFLMPDSWNTREMWGKMTTAAITIQKYYRRHAAQRLAQSRVRARYLDHLRQQQAEAECLAAQRSAAAAVLAEQGRSALIASGAQTQYAKVRARLLAAKGVRAGAPCLERPMLSSEAITHARSLGVDPRQVLLDAGLPPNTADQLLAQADAHPLPGTSPSLISSSSLLTSPDFSKSTLSAESSSSSTSLPLPATSASVMACRRDRQPSSSSLLDAVSPIITAHHRVAPPSQHLTAPSTSPFFDTTGACPAIPHLPSLAQISAPRRSASGRRLSGSHTPSPTHSPPLHRSTASDTDPRHPTTLPTRPAPLTAPQPRRPSLTASVDPSLASGPSLSIGVLDVSFASGLAACPPSGPPSQCSSRRTSRDTCHSRRTSHDGSTPGSCRQSLDFQPRAPAASRQLLDGPSLVPHVRRLSHEGRRLSSSSANAQAAASSLLYGLSVSGAGQVGSELAVGRASVSCSGVQGGMRGGALQGWTAQGRRKSSGSEAGPARV